MARGLNARRKGRTEKTIKCINCGAIVPESYAKNGVTFEVVGECQECRSERYGCAVNGVWDYERQHNINGGFSASDEQEVTEGENEDGEENPEIEVAEGNTNMAEKTTKEQTREEWLASLKPGDRVATYYHNTGYSVYVVARRTPSGRIVLTDGRQFNKEGDEISPAIRWHRDHLGEVTPKVVAAIRRDKLVSAVCHELDKISNINVVNKLSDERLEELLAVLTK